ncbi:putative chitinase 3 [Orchesella cincta]|uniref:Putative chitinase 3 n=1 Tax=Orchesella cincta TaxID=48709 RepID=A0A1D2M6B7_ORCCI|nr:putative chitinase 3 [Orchesella cincta]
MKTIVLALAFLIFHLSTTFAQSEDCPEEGVAYIPQPDCTLYVVCTHGQGNQMECPGSLFFNPRTNNCDFPGNVPECVEGTRSPIINGTTPRPTSTSTTTAPPNTITQCGQIIEQNSGFVQYKLYQNYDAGELCAFIIRLDRYTGCEFTLDNYDIRDPTLDTLTIFQVLDVQDTLPSIKLDTISSTVYLPGSTFVVVFKTETSQGTGFRFRFKSSNTAIGQSAAVPLIFNNRTETPLTFPLIANAIGQPEWDPIVITSNAKLITEPGSLFQLQVNDSFVSPECRSWFNIHSFDGTDAKFERR